MSIGILESHDDLTPEGRPARQARTARADWWRRVEMNEPSVYRVEYVSPDDDLQTALNRIASEGWRIVAVTASGAVIFERTAIGQDIHNARLQSQIFATGGGA